MRTWIAAACGAALLAGCAAHTPPNQAVMAAGPAAPALSAESYFREALSCMDDLLARLNDGQQGRRLLVLRTEDPTGGVSAGMEAMIIDAALAMTRRSRYFAVSDLLLAEDFNGSGFMVRSQVVEYDQGVFGQSQSGGLGVGAADLGAASNQTVSSVALNLRLLDAQSREVLPGASATHRIALNETDRGTDVRAEIGTVAGFMEFRVARSQALHQSVKALIDLNLIQIVGEYSGVAYEQCLTRASVSADNARLQVDAFAAMAPDARLSAIAGALRERGYYAGPVTLPGPTPALRQAVAAFQRDQRLPVSGDPGLEVYAALGLGGNASPEAGFPMHDEMFVSVTPASTALVVPPLGATLRRLAGPETLVAPASRPLAFAASVNRPGYLLCVHASSAGDLVRIYPNDKRPERRLEANEQITLPNGLDTYMIRPAWRDGFRAGDRTLAGLSARLESVFCYGSDRPFSRIWPEAWGGDVNGPVSALPFTGPRATAELGAAYLDRVDPDRTIGQLNYLVMLPNWTPQYEMRVQQSLDAQAAAPAES